MADEVDWAAMTGRAVTFTYLHGERSFGVVSSARRRTDPAHVGEWVVFVRFGASPQAEACDPALLSVDSYPPSHVAVTGVYERGPVDWAERGWVL